MAEPSMEPLRPRLLGGITDKDIGRDSQEMRDRDSDADHEEDESVVDVNDLMTALPRTVARNQDRTDQAMTIIDSMFANMWNMPTSKLKLIAMVIAVIGCGAFMTGIALVGLTVMMVMGGLLTTGALVVVLATCAMIAITVTGLPVGYLMYKQAHKLPLFGN